MQPCLPTRKTEECSCQQASTCSATTQWWGVLFQKEERKTGLGIVPPSATAAQTDFQAVLLYLAPPPLPPLEEPVTPILWLSRGFALLIKSLFHFASSGSRVQISQICFAICNQSICSPASRGSWLMSSPYLLFLEDLFIVKEIFHSYFSGEEFGRGVVIKYVCSAILNNSCFTNADFQLGSKVTGIWF